MADWTITGPSFHQPSIHIDACDDFTPAEAMRFALSVLEAARPHVTIADAEDRRGN
jgi:hypothetical protein